MKCLSKYWVIMLLLLVQSTTLFAQYTSAKGWFEADFVRGCEGLTVNVQFTSTTPLDCTDPDVHCLVNWGDGSAKNELTSHTYIDNGSFYLVINFQNDAQEDSVKIDIDEPIAPDFELYACTGKKIAVNITDTNYDNYAIDSGDGSGTEDIIARGAPDQIYSYATATNKTVVVRGVNNNAADNCASDTKTITVLNALPSGTIKFLEVIASNQAVLEYSLADNILYQLQIAANGNSVFAPLKTVSSNLVQDTLRGLDFEKNYYCFRIATKNACDNTNDNISTPICSINPALDIQDNLNRLSWKTQNPDIGFNIIRDDNPTSPLVGLPANTRSFDDTEITCNTDYCYTLVANYNGGATSTSLPVCGTSFSTVPPETVHNISTVIEGEKITVSWPAAASNADLTYSIYASEKNKLLGKTDSTTSFTTDQLDPQKKHCFKVLITDECGNKTTQSALGCTLLASGGITKLDQVNIEWDGYNGWENGVANYTVRKSYDLTNITSTSTIETSFSEADNSANQVIYYTVVARPNQNLPNSISNTIKLIKPNNIYFPNAFTPDGDGKNDTFMINGRFITSFQLYVFDRWGRIIFTTADMSTAWNGTSFDGKDLPQGTYAFRAKMTDEAGREIEKTGTILLLRK